MAKLPGAGKTALITGGSSGIGLELSRLFARDGYDIIIVARDEKELSKAALTLKYYGESVRTIATDLSRPEAAEELFRRLKGQDVDVLVNNAGFGVYGKFHETPLTRDVQMMELNMATLTKLTKLFLPMMLSRGSGRILNVASTAAFQPGPLMAVYYATKAYVLSFTEAIAEELDGSGVSVTALCPGPTGSGFQERAQMAGSKIIKGRLMSAEAVAKAGYSGLMKGKTIVIPGFKNAMFAFSVRLAPRKMVTRMVHRMQEREA
jgi:uncharacterized protein